MAGAEKLRRLVEEYAELLGRRDRHLLKPAEAQRLELMRDLLLEAGLELDSFGWPAPRRHARSALALEVSFGDAAAAARAVTREIGTGGLSLATDLVMPVGTPLSMRVNVPGWEAPLEAMGEVVWASPGALGVAFRQLAPADAQRLRELIAGTRSFVERLKGTISRKTPAVPAAVELQPFVLLALSEPELAAVISGVLELTGWSVGGEVPAGITPAVIAADVGGAMAASDRFPAVPLILVNVSGADALAGRASRLRPRAFVKRPATPGALLEAIRTVRPR